MLMNAESYLNKVKMLDQLIDAKLAERKRLTEIATNISPSPLDGMPHSNTGTVSRTMENAVINLIMLEQEINQLIDRYANYKKHILSMLEKLPAKEYSVLHKYYIQYMTIEQIADELRYSTVQVWRIKKSGLKILQNLFEKENILQNVVECNVPKC